MSKFLDHMSFSSCCLQIISNDNLLYVCFTSISNDRMIFSLFNVHKKKERKTVKQTESFGKQDFSKKKGYHFDNNGFSRFSY
jgi:hypothetical protein